MKKAISIVLALIFVLSTFSMNIVSANTNHDITLKDLKTIELTEKGTNGSQERIHQEEFNLAQDTILAVYATTPVQPTNTYEKIFYTVVHLIILDSAGNELYNTKYMNEDDTIEEMKYYLPAGKYTVRFSTKNYFESVQTFSYAFKLYDGSGYRSNIDNKPNINGDSLDYKEHRFLTKDLTQYVDLKKGSIISTSIKDIKFITSDENIPKTADWTMFLKVYDSKGKEVLKEEFLLGGENHPQNKYYQWGKKFYLPKGKYKIEYSVVYYEYYDNHYYYEFNRDPLTCKYNTYVYSEVTDNIKTPKLSYKLSGKGSKRKLTLKWSDYSKQYSDYNLIVYKKTNNGKWSEAFELRDTSKKNQHTVSYTEGTFDYYKVKIWNIQEGFRFYSGYSNTISIKEVGVPQFSVKAGKNKSTVKVTKAVKNVNEYEIWYSTKKNGKYKKVKTIKGKTKSYTQKKLKSKKRIYYKVRAVKRIGKTVGYSSFTKVKSVKIK